MKGSGSFIAPERVFEKLRALCTERTVEGSTVLFGQGETPKEVVLVLHGEIALTPDATEPTLCRIASAGALRTECAQSLKYSFGGYKRI